MLLGAAGGVFPPVDGAVDLLPPLSAGLGAVVSFTGHAAIACDVTGQELAGFDLHGFGSAVSPQMLSHLAGEGGRVGDFNVTLAAQGHGGGSLPQRHDLDEHPRVQHARAVREQVSVHGDQRGLLTLAGGLAGRTEISVEVDPHHQGHGAGQALIEEGLALLPSGEVVFAAVSPGNARSLRTFLAAGFQPVGSEVLLIARDHPGR